MSKTLRLILIGIGALMISYDLFTTTDTGIRIFASLCLVMVCGCFVSVMFTDKRDFE